MCITTARNTEDMLSISDVVEYAERWANEGKIVIVAALDGTFARKPFNSILELIPLAEQVSLSSWMKILSINTAFQTPPIRMRSDASNERCLLGDAFQHHVP